MSLRLLAFLLLAAPLVVAAQTPFGNPIALPGTFEAENFDNGGEGVAYHDNVAGNAGGQYRTNESVDIVVSRDAAIPGYVVNNFETGEWLAYTVDIAAAGQYEIALRVASGEFTGAFRIEIDGANVTGSVAVPPTGNFGSFQWVAKAGVSLPAGRHILKLVSEQQYFDVNQIRVTATPTTPFAGVIQLPGTFEAENFDRGGEGLAYHDNVAGNAGGQYRIDEHVDIRGSTDPAGGGHVVYNFETGEWLVYTVNVATAGVYDIDLRVASGNFTNSAFHIEIDGANVTGSIAVPPTGNFDTFQWVGKRGVALGAGQHVLRLVADQQYFDVNQIRVTQVLHSPFNGTPLALPGTFEAENFDNGGEGNAYHDNVAGNAGGVYRTDENVDIRGTTDPAGGGHVVYNFETGEWLVYTVDIAAAGLYDIELRLASGTSSSSAFHVEIDGADVTGRVAVPATGSFGSFQWVGKNSVQLPAGQHVLKLVSEQQYFDVNQIRVTPSSSSGEVRFFCTFETGWTECGFTEQKKQDGQPRASIVNIGRHGTTAVRLHTKPGDSNVSGSGSRERNDLRLPGSSSYCSQGQEEWWAHSVLFPSDYVVPSSGVVMDFHHSGSSGQANFHISSRSSNLIFLGYGGATVATGTDHPGHYQAPIGPIVRNQWYDFVYHVKWSSGSDGFMHAWVNGVKKLTHLGPTLYSGMSCYLKLANYHTPTAASSIIHDRVVRGTSADAVSLTPLQP